MVHLAIPYDRSHLTVGLEDSRLAAVLVPAVATKGTGSAEELVRAALANPLSSPPLAELARGRRRIVVVTSDHTRPIPSRITIPPLLAEIRRGNPAAEITILVGMGTHRQPTQAELEAKFGPEVMAREEIVLHHGDRPDELKTIDLLPSGYPVELNKRAAEADLLVAEGFINPHLFAGFSGGPKSILPGISSQITVRRNHCGRNIGHPRARAGILTGNPIHEEMEIAADMARLAFILNVVVSEDGGLVAALAGDWRAVHARGVGLVKARVGVPAVFSSVTVTSHGGYPLDQNLYQAVKGMVTAEMTTKPGRCIVLAAACLDGIGGESFARTMAEMTSPADYCRRVENVPPDETIPDQWTSQILARILANYRVLLVASGIPPETILPPGLFVRESLQDALDEALAGAGPNAMVTVVPDGARTLPLVE